MGVADAMRLGWRVMPDRVSVTLRSQQSPGLYADVPAPSCWRRGNGLVEGESSAGVYCFQRATWFVPKLSRVPQPKPGDLIRLSRIDNAASPHHGLHGDYIVLPGGVSEVGSLGAWSCDTAIPFLQDGLTDTVTVWQPHQVSGDGARPTELGREVLAEGVAAKIMPDSPLTMDETFGQMARPLAAKCYLATAVNIRPHSYVEDQHGRTWTVTQQEFTEILGVLMAVGLERYE